MKDRPAGPTALPGSLTRLELWERYALRSGLPAPAPLFYYVFALFKITGIIQQIYRRFVDGHTRDERFAGLDRRVRILGGQAARALDRGRIHALGA